MKYQRERNRVVCEDRWWRAALEKLHLCGWEETSVGESAGWAPAGIVVC